MNDTRFFNRDKMDTQEFDTRRYWFRKPQVSVCLEGDNAVFFDSDTGREKVVNSTGFVVWQAMDGISNTEGLAAALARRCAVPFDGQIRLDVETFAEELLRDGFVVASDTPAPAPAQVESYSRIEEAPRDFDISLTGRCNLHCAYCFYNDEMVGRNDLPAKRWLDFFGELRSLAVRNVTLSGGEVFTRRDLWALIDGVVESRMRYSILTNGTLIDETTLLRFQRKGRRNRLNSIQVSIDGSRPAIHDASRGKGSFEKALRGLRLLKEAGFPVTVRVTVNRHNVDDLDNIARLLLDDVGISRFSTNDAMPMGTGCAHQDRIMLLPEQRPVAMRAQVRLQEERPGTIIASAGSLALWHMFCEMEQAKATGQRPNRWKMGCLSSCGCMFCKLAVHHDGMIVPCNMLAAASLGTIGETPVRSIWRDHPLLEEMRKRDRIRMEEVPGCEGCEWAPFCSGGCPAVEYTRTGNLYVANPSCCYRKFLQETKSALREEMQASNAMC